MAVPTWKKNLDALVEETMSCVASVKVPPKQIDPVAVDLTVSGDDARDRIVQTDAPVFAAVEAVLAQEPPLPDLLAGETKPSPAKLRSKWASTSG
jgi:hypothetical protein